MLIVRPDSPFFPQISFRTIWNTGNVIRFHDMVLKLQIFFRLHPVKLNFRDLTGNALK